MVDAELSAKFVNLNPFYKTEVRFPERAPQAVHRFVAVFFGLFSLIYEIGGIEDSLARGRFCLVKRCTLNHDLRGGRVRRSGFLKSGAALTVAERPEAEWGRIRRAILEALEPFEEARDAVRAALMALRELLEEERIDAG